jgi:hypothetical protein
MANLKRVLHIQAIAQAETFKVLDDFSILVLDPEKNVYLEQCDDEPAGVVGWEYCGKLSSTIMSVDYDVQPTDSTEEEGGPKA